MSDQGRAVAWVTGASRGMGADTAVRLAEAGYNLALTARDQSRLDSVAERLAGYGAQTLPYAADLTDRHAMTKFADKALDRFGRCDVLCNIGIYQGPGASRLLCDTRLDEMSLSFEADVVAPALLCQKAIPSMKVHGGTIINMSSSVVFLDPPGTVQSSGWSFAYAAAKGGIDRLASILNAELGDYGIRAYNVEPGFVAYGDELEDSLQKYPGVPVSPPEAIGPAILWLIQSPSSARLLRKRVYLPGLTHKQGLLPGWQGPGSRYFSS